MTILNRECGKFKMEMLYTLTKQKRRNSKREAVSSKNIDCN